LGRRQFEGGARSQQSLYYSVISDDYSTTLIFAVDPTATSPADPIWVRNISATVGAFAVESQSATLYYTANGLVYCTGLAQGSPAHSLLTDVDIRSMKLVYEGQLPALYFTGCDGSNFPSFGRRSQRLQKRDSCTGSVQISRMELFGQYRYELLASMRSSAMDLVYDLDVRYLPASPAAQTPNATFIAYVVGRKELSYNSILTPLWVQIGRGGTVNAPLLYSTYRGVVIALGESVYGLFRQGASQVALLRLSLAGGITSLGLTDGPASDWEIMLTKDESSSTLFYATGNSIVAVQLNSSSTNIEPRLVVKNVRLVADLVFAPPGGL
jgi:hypothetical protein